MCKESTYHKYYYEKVSKSIFQRDKPFKSAKQLNCFSSISSLYPFCILFKIQFHFCFVCNAEKTVCRRFKKLTSYNNSSSPALKQDSLLIPVPNPVYYADYCIYIAKSRQNTRDMSALAQNQPTVPKMVSLLKIYVNAKSHHLY